MFNQNLKLRKDLSSRVQLQDDNSAAPQPLDVTGYLQNTSTVDQKHFHSLHLKNRLHASQLELRSSSTKQEEQTLSDRVFDKTKQGKLVDLRQAFAKDIVDIESSKESKSYVQTNEIVQGESKWEEVANGADSLHPDRIYKLNLTKKPNKPPNFGSATNLGLYKNSFSVKPPTMKGLDKQTPVSHSKQQNTSWSKH